MYMCILQILCLCCDENKPQQLIQEYHQQRFVYTNNSTHVWDYTATSLKASSQYTLERALRNLPALRCDRKCIQNDLDVRRVCWNRNNFYSSVHASCDVRPNHFVCTSGHNARSSVYCEPALTPKSGASRAHNKHSVSQSIGTTTCVYDHVCVFTCASGHLKQFRSIITSNNTGHMCMYL